MTTGVELTLKESLAQAAAKKAAAEKAALQAEQARIAAQEAQADAENRRQEAARTWARQVLASYTADHTAAQVACDAARMHFEERIFTPDGGGAFLELAEQEARLWVLHRRMDHAMEILGERMWDGRKHLSAAPHPPLTSYTHTVEELASRRALDLASDADEAFHAEVSRMLAGEG